MIEEEEEEEEEEKEKAEAEEEETRRGTLKGEGGRRRKAPFECLSVKQCLSVLFRKP